MGGDEDRLSLAGEVLDEFPVLPDALGIEVCRRFVEKSTSGSLISVWASPSRCFMPREYSPAFWVTPSRWTSSSSSAIRSFRFPASIP